jgi:hypothetical protein
MPNSSNEWTTVIGAGISAFFTVLGMILVQILNNRSNKRQREIDSKERFFYEVYPKRITLYEEIIKELGAIIESGQSLMGPDLTREACVKKISKDTHSLNNLLARIRIFGSSPISKIFEGLLAMAHNSLSHLNKGHYHVLMLSGWIITVQETLDNFVRLVQKDAGYSIIDVTIKRYLSIAKINRFKRFTDKLFNYFRLVKNKKRMDKFLKRYHKSLRHEKNTPENSKH